MNVEEAPPLTDNGHVNKQCSLFAVAFGGEGGQEPQDDRPLVPARCGCSFTHYLLLSCLLVGGMSSTAVLLWSGMGMGERCLLALREAAALRPLPVAACVLLLLLLYLLDFFWPPHLPGQILALWDGDRCSRRWLLGAVSGLLLAAALLSTEEDPSWPLLATIAMCPVSMAALHATLQKPRTVAELLAEKIAHHGDRRAKAMLLQVLVKREEDEMRFLWAALLAFALNAAVVFFSWVSWVLGGGTAYRGRTFPLADGDGAAEQEDLEYLLWSTPVVVAASDFVFGALVALRIAAQRSYEATDSCKAQLLEEQEVIEETGAISATALEACRQQSNERRERLGRHLSMLMKVFCMAFMFMLGVLYILGQLLYAESIMSSTLGGVLGLYFLVFVAFIYLAFRRIVFALGQWLANQPFWRFFKIVHQSSWMRAFIVCLVLPFIPLVLLLSVLNQRVRLLRGLYTESDCPEGGPQPQAIETLSSLTPSSLESAKSFCCHPRPEKLLFTLRLHTALDAARRWDWLAVLLRCYVYCGSYLCYTICPLLLNIMLSWLGGVLHGWPFLVVIFATFLIGVVAFLLPPVPGMTVYIFGGLVISRAAEVGGYGGFWVGSLINIGVCWLLKLFACAVQQKCIGELLGQSLWVRKTVGVHRAHIRCIEAILREPGMSVGKVAILCGGPDWPTSVLAGVLRLSLAQCELGTMPIILFVAPCALTGSFYLKRGVSEVWNRSAKLMIIVSIAVNLLLWALAAWAIQRQLERHHEELTRPRPDNADLEWLDYRAAQLEKVSQISWSGTPSLIRWCLALCAGLQIITCQGLFWLYSYLFGDFRVEDDINNLVWRSTGRPNEKYIFAVSSAPLVLLIFALAWVGPLFFWRWRRSAVRGPRREAALALDLAESSWKERWVREACNRDSGASASSGSECDLPLVPEPEPLQPGEVPTTRDSGLGPPSPEAGTAASTDSSLAPEAEELPVPNILQPCTP